MNRDYWPEGCNPPETCFTCRHPDCRNRLSGTKKEFDFTRRGLAPDYVVAHGSNEKRSARRRFREENGLCIYCGKPLTAEDGEYKSCAACREMQHAKYRERKKISRAQGAAERK